MRIRLSKPYEQTGYKIQGLFREHAGGRAMEIRSSMYTSFTNKSMPVKPAPEFLPIQRIRLRFAYVICHMG